MERSTVNTKLRELTKSPVLLVACVVYSNGTRTNEKEVLVLDHPLPRGYN